MSIDDDEVPEEMVVSKDVETRDASTKDRVSDDRPPLSFPCRHKHEEEGKIEHFIPMLKQLSINIPLIEALKKMSGYAKFMKGLVMKKRTIIQVLS